MSTSTLVSSVSSALRSSPPRLTLSTSSLRDYEPTPAPPPSPVDWQDSPSPCDYFTDRFGAVSLMADSNDSNAETPAEDWSAKRVTTSA